MISFRTAHFLSFLPFWIMVTLGIHRVRGVKGCVTMMTGNDFSVKESFCDRTDTKFTRIPESLPKEVIRLTINYQTIHILDSRQLQHLPNLTYLNMDSNKITVIKRDAFTSVPFLKELSLRFNHLTLSVDSYHPGALTSITQLEYLNLMGNPIGKVPAYFFYPMRESLRSLVLASSNLEFSISLEALEGVFNLEVLDLSYNNLETLPDTFNGLFTTMNLKQLFLFGNPWKCDCSLKWLREWMEKHNSTKFLIDPQQPGVNGLMMDPLFQMEPVAVENAAYPKCASPSELAGRSIVYIPGINESSISPYDMACPPKPKSSFLSFRGRIGGNVTLSCEFEASAIEEVFWYKNGKPLGPSSRVKLKHIRQGLISVELIFFNIEHSDIATYICLIKNGFGKANTTVILALQDSTGLQSVLGDSHWTVAFNYNTVLKYTSIAVIGLVLLLISIGIVVFLCYRQNKKNGLKSVANASHAKPPLTEIIPLNGIHSLMSENENNHRYTQPPRYSPSRELPLTPDRHPYILSFQDSHALYPLTESGIIDVQGKCPVHGISKSSSYITTEKPYDTNSLTFSTIDRTYDTPSLSRNLTSQISPVLAAVSRLPLERIGEKINPSSVDHTAKRVTDLPPPLIKTLADVEAASLSPVVRSTRTIKLTPHTELATSLSERTNALKTKHVEFADDPKFNENAVEALATTANPCNDAGFITTV